MGKLLKSNFVKGVLVGIFFALAVFAARLACAQELVGATTGVLPEPVEDPSFFLKMIVGIALKFYPAGQTYLAMAIGWMGNVAAILTLLSAFVAGTSKVLQSTLKNYAWAEGLLAKINAAESWLLPKLKYLSMFNVQKKPSGDSKG